MAALDQYNLSHDLAFNQPIELIRRVQMLMQKSAIAVAAEDPATANHAARVTFGNKVLMNPSGYAELMAQGVVSGGIITAASSDSDIEFTVNSLWNAYAIV